VICESIERVARRTYFGTKIEYELEQCGVALWAADEPFSAAPRGRRSTPILTRRIKQAVAEWFVLQMLELSWDGTVEHTRQGWNIGKPPYGYLAEKIPHPVAAKRAEGRTKHRLIPHPTQAPVVARIYELRATSRLGYDRIADVLNLNLEANPPPEPTRVGEGLGRWSATAVRDVLLNPKYTGYMVYNRRATKNGNRANPASEWIWSPQQAHQPLVTRELYADRPWFEQHPDTVRVRASVIEPLIDQFVAATTQAPISATPSSGLSAPGDRAASANAHISTLLRRQDQLIEELELLGECREAPHERAALRAAIHRRFLDLEVRISAVALRLPDLPGHDRAGYARDLGPSEPTENESVPTGRRRDSYIALGLDARYDHLEPTLTVTVLIKGGAAETKFLLTET
jgi:hypothetical protein